MQKVIFLDRDGVINNNSREYYIYKKEDLVINKGIVENLLKLKEAGFKFIIISNQGGISRGIYTKNDVEIVHNEIIKHFKSHNIVFEEIYYCPHHVEYENCICRKPDSLLIEKAIARFNIDIEKSFFIGDSKRDTAAAKKAGIKGILINANEDITKYCTDIINGNHDKDL